MTAIGSGTFVSIDDLQFYSIGSTANISDVIFRTWIANTTSYGSKLSNMTTYTTGNPGGYVFPTTIYITEFSK